MNEVRPSPHWARIAPLPPDTPRPLWSVMIPTYHCAQYLRQTLESVLQQAPDPQMMQIEVVDDHSTRDDPAAVVAELGCGRVAFHQQPQNVGHIRNFDTCLQRARGRLVHLLHGDDLVRDGFYRQLQGAFQTSPTIGAAFCRHIYMKEDGHWDTISRLERSTSGVLPDWLPRIAAGQRLVTPAMVVRREVYERLGGFDRRIAYNGEDWEMWVRIAAHYPIWYEVEPLAVYRANGPGSLTARARRTGADIRDMCRATAIIEEYLPPGPAHAAANRARETYAHWAINTAREQLGRRHLRAAVAQVREGLRCSCAPRVLGRLLVLLGWAVLGGLRLLLRQRAAPPDGWARREEG